MGLWIWRAKWGGRGWGDWGFAVCFFGFACYFCFCYTWLSKSGTNFTLFFLFPQPSQPHLRHPLSPRSPRLACPDIQKLQFLTARKNNTLGRVEIKKLSAFEYNIFHGIHGKGEEPLQVQLHQLRDKIENCLTCVPLGLDDQENC